MKRKNWTYYAKIASENYEMIVPSFFFRSHFTDLSSVPVNDSLVSEVVTISRD